MQDFIQPSETILSAFNCSIASPRQRSHTTKTENTCGYCLVTKFRIILVIFNQLNESNVHSTSYHKENVHWDWKAVVFRRKPDHRSWFFQPFTKRELALEETVTISVKLQDLRELRHRTISIQAVQPELVIEEFQFGEQYIAVAHADGELILKLIEYALQHSGEINDVL